MLKFIFLVLVLLTILHDTNASILILPTFNWDPRNEIFQGKVCGGNEDYAHISVQENSEIYFLCPSSVIFSSIQREFTSRLNMYENMFIVTKDEFERCQVDGITQHTKKVMNCDKPKDSYAIKYRRFYFSSYQTSTGIPFVVNNTYYFIATSNGTLNSLDNHNGGRCKTNNMRLAVTVCGANENCVQHNNLCKTPKASPKPPVVVTMTTTKTTKRAKPTKMTTRTTEDGIVIKPKAAPKQNDEDAPSSKSDGFGVVAVCCLIGGLFVGLIIGCVAVIFTQKYANRSKKTKNQQPYTDDKFDQTKYPKNYPEVNPAYRHSTEFKRLLSTSSNASSERYSVVPPVPRSSPPPGTVAV